MNVILTDSDDKIIVRELKFVNRASLPLAHNSLANYLLVVRQNLRTIQNTSQKTGTFDQLSRAVSTTVNKKTTYPHQYVLRRIE